MLLFLLALALIVPVVFMIMGIVSLLSSDSQIKKKARNFLLSGILIILIEILTGCPVCSGARIH